MLMKTKKIKKKYRIPKSWLDVLLVLTQLQGVENDYWCCGDFDENKYVPYNDGEDKYGDACIFLEATIEDDFIRCSCPRECHGTEYRFLRKIFGISNEERGIPKGCNVLSLTFRQEIVKKYDKE